MPRGLFLFDPFRCHLFRIGLRHPVFFGNLWIVCCGFKEPVLFGCVWHGNPLSGADYALFGCFEQYSLFFDLMCRRQITGHLQCPFDLRPFGIVSIDCLPDDMFGPLEIPAIDPFVAVSFAWRAIKIIHGLFLSNKRRMTAFNSSTAFLPLIRSRPSRAALLLASGHLRSSRASHSIAQRGQ